MHEWARSFGQSLRIRDVLFLQTLVQIQESTSEEPQLPPTALSIPSPVYTSRGQSAPRNTELNVRASPGVQC